MFTETNGTSSVCQSGRQVLLRLVSGAVVVVNFRRSTARERKLLAGFRDALEATGGG